jgi:hypothetical protein
MTAKGKVLVTISSAHEADSTNASDACSGNQSPAPRLLIVDAIVEALECRKISIVDLRVVLPSQSAKAMLRGMLEGETEIAITGMSPVVESSQK